eukprot:scaffold568_cov376-Prasinococcus_capsulatus_cf.AAC.8
MPSRALACEHGSAEEPPPTAAAPTATAATTTTTTTMATAPWQGGGVGWQSGRWRPRARARAGGSSLPPAGSSPPPATERRARGPGGGPKMSRNGGRRARGKQTGGRRRRRRRPGAGPQTHEDQDGPVSAHLPLSHTIFDDLPKPRPSPRPNRAAAPGSSSWRAAVRQSTPRRGLVVTAAHCRP